MSLRCDLLDTAVTERVLTVLQPAELQVAEEALRQLEHRDEAMSAQWRMRLERAEYEAQLAQRRHEEVDPSNRLVAATFEQRWDDALVRLEEVRTQFADFQSQEALVVTPAQRACVAPLGPRLPAPVERADDQGEGQEAHPPARDQGHHRRAVRRTQDRRLACPVAGRGVRRPRGHGPPTLPTASGTPTRSSTACASWLASSDEQVAPALNREGRRRAKGGAFNVSMVRWIRHKHRIPAPDFQRPGERSVRQVADELGVSRNVVYSWIDRGVVTARRRNRGSPYSIAFDDDTRRHCALGSETPRRI